MAEYIVSIENDKITSAVGLVRCKDCKHIRKYASGVTICTAGRWAMTKENDFCSDGELNREERDAELDNYKKPE